MKTFGELICGDIIYRCNFDTNEFDKYEIISIDKSRYNNQKHLSAKRLKNDETYYAVNVVMHIDVFDDNSYEQARQLIDHSDNITWFADKNMIMTVFNKYKNKKIEYLNKLETNLKKFILQ